MLRFASIRTRIVVLTALPTAAMLGALLLIVHRTAVPTVERTIREELMAAGAVTNELLVIRADGLARMADVIARDPRFFATFAVPEEERGEEFAATIEAVAEDFLHITDADFLEIYLQSGRICRLDRELGSVGSDLPQALPKEVRRALHGPARSGITEDDGMLCSIIAAPVRLGGETVAVLRLGQWLDGNFAQEIRRLTGAEIAFCGDGQCRVETLASLGESSRFTGGAQVDESEIAGELFLVTALDLPGLDGSLELKATLGMPKATAIAPLTRMEQSMMAIALLGIFAILVGGAAVAVGVTRPLSRVVSAAERLEAGNYDEPLQLEGEDEVARLAQSFVNMRESLKAHVNRLEDLDKIKSDFIALAGHELRTPLTVVTGFNNLISEGAFGEIPGEVRETSEIIKQQLTRLSDQVENMLDLSRFEQGSAALSLAPTEICVLLRDALAKHEGQRADRTLHMVDHICGELPPVSCDPKRIEQVFLLLLDNAVRYTPDGGTITIDAQLEHDGVRVSVQDTGIGIANSQIPWIFDKFYEAQDINRHSSGNLEFGAGGFGMGLALSQTILAAHGSSIDVQSRVGEGSRFSFLLPVESNTAALATT